MKPAARKDDFVFQEMGGETLIYDLRTNKAICPNQTSALVRQNCDRQKNALKIAGIIKQKINPPLNREFIRFAFSQLKNERLLETEKNSNHQNFCDVDTCITKSVAEICGRFDRTIF